MKKYAIAILPFVLFSLAAGHASAQGQGSASEFVHNVMGPWAKRGTPVLFAECMDTHTQAIIGVHAQFKHMIFFPLGEAKGTYAVFAWGDAATWKEHATPAAARLETLGSITVKAHVEIDTPDQGGPWELAHEQLNGEYLLRKGLTLIQPADFSAAIIAPAKITCPDWDYASSDPEGVEKFYKKQGWRY